MLYPFSHKTPEEVSPSKKRPNPNRKRERNKKNIAVEKTPQV
jgi:hypothetical protein